MFYYLLATYPGDWCYPARKAKMAKRRSLTDLAVQKLPLPAKGQRDHFDPNYPGLAIRASHGGRKMWAYMFRAGRRQRRMTLGTYPAMRHCQTNLNGPAKGAGLKRSSCQLTPLG